MNVKRITIVAATMVTLVGMVCVVMHCDPAHQVDGTVALVNASHIELETTDGERVPIVVDERTRYFRGKTPIDANAVKVGERVVVQLVEAPSDKKLARKVSLFPVVATTPNSSPPSGSASRKP